MSNTEHKWMLPYLPGEQQWLRDRLASSISIFESNVETIVTDEGRAACNTAITLAITQNNPQTIIDELKKQADTRSLSIDTKKWKKLQENFDAVFNEMRRNLMSLANQLRATDLGNTWGAEDSTIPRTFLENLCATKVQSRKHTVMDCGCRRTQIKCTMGRNQTDETRVMRDLCWVHHKEHNVASKRIAYLKAFDACNPELQTAEVRKQALENY
jgi:hypothetical protein